MKYIRSNASIREDIIFEQLETIISPLLDVLDDLKRRYDFTYELKSDFVGRPISSWDGYSVSCEINSFQNMNRSKLVLNFKNLIRMCSCSLQMFDSQPEVWVFIHRTYKKIGYDVDVDQEGIINLPKLTKRDIDQFKSNVENTLQEFESKAVLDASDIGDVLKISRDVLPAIKRYCINRMNSMLEEYGVSVSLIPNSIKRNNIKDPNRKYFTYMFQDDNGNRYTGYYSFVREDDEGNYVPVSEIYDDSDELWGDVQQVIDNN